ncbi:MAG: histidinol-phosphate transaminase [Nitrospiraceae bacterium]|jgi:histidinol-phosphate aminotransferase|nr:histidinol-phosphate transaminase [Nitrospiraceae bacterium]
MKTIDFTALARQNIRSLTAYEAKEIPCRIKLDANESPVAPVISLDPKVLSRLNRYPDPQGSALKKTLAREHGVMPDQLLLGNGSDEIISYLITTFGGPVLYPVPTFSMYGITAQTLGEPGIGIPLQSDMQLDQRKMVAAIRKLAPKLIFLSTPNNPTGNAFQREAIEEIIRISGGIVVVDEAYQPFSREKSFIPDIKRFPRLAVLRTFSKIGLAALRLGYLVADSGLITEVNKVRLPYNVNALSQALVLASLRQKNETRAVVKEIVSEREKMAKELRGMPGIDVVPSDANFILLRMPNADAVHAALIAAGILVRNLGSAVPNALRVTIGTPKENAAFLAALRKIMKERS